MCKYTCKDILCTHINIYTYTNICVHTEIYMYIYTRTYLHTHDPQSCQQPGQASLVKSVESAAARVQASSGWGVGCGTGFPTFNYHNLIAQYCLKLCLYRLNSFGAILFSSCQYHHFRRFPTISVQGFMTGTYNSDGYGRQYSRLSGFYATML